MLMFYEHDMKGSQYHVGVEVSEDKLSVSDWAMGDFVDQTWHDSDIEHYVIIKREDIDQFVRACCNGASLEAPDIELKDADVLRLLGQVYTGHRNAIFEIKDVLKSNNIPYEFQVW